MRVTNRFDLPEAFVRFDKRNAHSRGDADISTTELIDSPRIRKLRMRYEEEMEEDISQRVMSILGTAVHNILEQGAPTDCIVEERLFMDAHGMRVSGQLDLQTPTSDGILISDYKTTSAYAIQANPDGKKEWTQQLNIYRALAEANGKKVSGLEVVAVIRDWTASGLKRSSQYPEVPVIRIPIEMWDPEVGDQYLRAMVGAHSKSGLTECDSFERWERPTTWAVYGETKSGTRKKRALRVYDNIVEAQQHVFQLNGYGVIEERPGESIRCQSYCPVSSKCSQWKEIQENQNGQT